MAIPKFQDFLYPFLLQLKDKDVSNKEMGGCRVTASTFTQGARESVSKATSKIVLIDGIALAKYMIEFNVGVSTRKTYEVKRIDTNYFEE